MKAAKGFAPDQGGSHSFSNNRGVNKETWARSRAKLRATQSRGLPDISAPYRGEFHSDWPDWVIKDFEDSGISPDLTMANVRYAEGVEALELMGISRLSRSDRAKACDSGIWYGYGSTLDGGEGDSIYAKPRCPRKEFKDGKIKLIKYETRSGQPASPLLPVITPYYCGLIEKRYGVTRNEGETPWQFIQRTGIPIVITEGLKKALSLTSIGIPAIALRGVTCWHPGGSSELWPEIGQFASDFRQFYICFDQDSKEKTVIDVCRQVSKLGKALEARKCRVSVLFWEPELGKGIDDVLVGLGDEAEAWLEELVQTAPTLAEWSKHDLVQYRKRVLARLQSHGITPERVTEGQYFPTLPRVNRGDLFILSSKGTGAGKTERIGKDIVKDWTDKGGFVLALCPLISLGKGTANRWGLPHLGDINVGRRDEWVVLRHQVEEAGGLVLCPNSLHRVQEFIKPDQPLLIVIDEANQVASELTHGATLKERQVEILSLFAENCRLAAENGAIVLAEAGVYRRTIDLVKRLSGIEKVRLFEHNGTGEPWDCEILTSTASGYLQQFLIPAMRADKKIILFVSSKNQGRKIERFVGSSKKVLRIDSETNRAGAFDQFFCDPDKFLSSLPELPDILIISPSVKSGVSITLSGKEKFDAVHALCTCHEAAMWFQGIGRCRLPIPRKIVVANQIAPNSFHEKIASKSRIAADLEARIRGYERVFDCEADIEQAALALEIESAVKDFYSADVTASGLQKLMPAETLADLLKGAGHNVTVDSVPGDKDLGEVLQAIQIELWKEDADQISKSNPGEMSVKEALKVLSTESSLEAEIAARKVLWRDEFPGVSFDDPQDCYAALTENFGELRRGVLLQTRAQNLELFKPVEAERVQEILRQDVKLAHKLPQSFFKAALIQHLGITSLLDGNPYTEEDPRIVLIKQQALHFAGEIEKYLLLHVNEEQTGIEIANKILRRLDLEATVIKAEGKRGQQIRHWGIPALCNPIRVRLLQAAFKKIGADPSTIPTRHPETYYAAIRERLESALDRLQKAKEKASERAWDTLEWFFNAKDKVARLQEKLRKASKDDWAEKVAGWLAAAQDKLSRLQALSDKARAKLSNIDSSIKTLTTELEQCGQVG